MIREVEIRVAPEAAHDEEAIARELARTVRVPRGSPLAHRVLRRSIDARRAAPAFVLRVQLAIDEPLPREETYELRAREVSRAVPVIVVGSGPGGLFAALELIERGLRPIVLERGRDVRGRRHDVARLCRAGVVDPESNYCFGEGGAGTFSDGKLYTRSTKRGAVRRVLELLVQHGASRDILIDAHPHVGTNRLPGVVEALRRTIVACGGEVRFAARVVDLRLDGGAVRGVVLASGEEVRAPAVILATGHSARDVPSIFERHRLALEAKPFAVGVRVEHPQSLIDAIQYRCAPRPSGLPAASYALVARSGERGVFSFCMCPGGVICPAATSPGEVVVNGWSPSSRSGRFANSGIVAEVSGGDLVRFAARGALAGLALQEEIEHAAHRAGGGALVAPAQRLEDFCAARESRDLPPASYLPGLAAADLDAVLPAEIAAALRSGLRTFGRRLRGYLTNEAVVVGVESRTSSPVRIPRDPHTLLHPQVDGLFPCGEGAGYAGGIMSAALDGVRCAIAAAAFAERSR